ncbi:MAG TPA: potassium channel family protein, partial [Candidatus Methylomirabilis sp.]|nr:potassium channel family protein [Candidatus Methylomirabilis sp.]
YQGLGPRFQAASGSVGFGTLLYLSASTFLTLGLGDVTSADSIGRLCILLEAGSGYIFLALMITYMPVLDQAYGVREVGNLLIHSRAGRPPSAIKLLRRYSRADRSEILRGNLREAERWMAEILQSHLSHPVLSFYRAQHWGQSWLVSLTTVLDACALLIAGGNGRLAAQARITYRMGIRLLKDLTEALDLSVNPRCTLRLSTDDLPALIAAMKGSDLLSSLGPGEAIRLLRLVRRHDVYLTALSRWLVIPLPSLTMPLQEQRETEASSGQRARADLPVPRTMSLDRLSQPADGQADIPPGVRKK